MHCLLYVRDLEQAAPLAARWSRDDALFIAVPGDRFAALGQGRFSLRVGDPQDHAQLLAALPALPDRVLYAWPWSGGDAPPLTPPAVADELALGVEGAFLVCQALLAAPLDKPVTLLYVHPCTDAAGMLVHEAFGAFAKTVAHESRKLRCRRVGLDDAVARPLHEHLDTVQAEFGRADANTDTEVRYIGGVRQRRVFKEVSAPPPGPAGLPLREDGVYLVSGGVGGLGYIVARHMASLQRIKLVLFGRRPFDERIAERMEELQFLGASCVYYSVDVGHAGAVQTLIDEVHRTLGPVQGLICAAGIHRDALIVKKSLADFRQVLRPKVMGALNLDLATRDDPLDFVVYFSSIAALLGNMGQADYSYANSFLDHFAAYREGLRLKGQRQGKTVSINWPLWQDGGMQVDEQVRIYAERTLGMPPLGIEAGLNFLGDAMRMQAPQVFVTRGERSKVEKWFGISHAAAAPALPPAPAAAAVTVPAAAPQAQVLRALQADLLAGVVDILQIDPKDAEADTDLNRFGFDSLTFTTFGNRISAALKIDLSPVVFFEYQTVRELAEYMVQEHPAEIMAWYQRHHAAPPPPPPHAQAASAPAVPAPAPVALPPPPVAPGPAVVRAPAVVAAAPQATDRVLPQEPIAIIGIDAVLPQSPDLDTFWEHLHAGANLVTEVPAERWDWRDVWGDPFQEKNKTRIKWGGFVPDTDKFDAAFFGISAREAALMDPQHRMFLQTVWRCIEDGGYRASTLARHQKVGLFCGSASIDYHDIMLRSDVDIDVFAVTGGMFSVLVNRISYLLNFRGPSEPVETACSSSLVAIHRAVQSIRAGECEVAIAGGVHLMHTPSVHIGLDKGGFLSQQGRCATFDKDADGYVRGEGCVALMLKPLSRAEADGDVIHAVIRGSMVNHGGQVNTLTTPNPNAQTEVIVEAWKRAGVDPRTIGYIEAHGTGTALGDPIEIKALRRAFDELYAHWGVADAPREKHCGVGSVKSNIGHLEFVAGASGVAKMLLAMREKTLPASIHFNALNPYIQLDKSPLHIVDRRVPWTRALEADGREAPLRAGVSSFGFGGVNCHVALEEYRPGAGSVPAQAAAPGPQVVVLSAKDPAALQRVVAQLLARLQRTPVPALADLAYTLASGREPMPERLLIVASDIGELQQALAMSAQASAGHAKVFRGNKADGRSRLAFLASPEEAQRHVQSLIEADDLVQLARCWVDGLDVDWSATRYARGRRIVLPTYPFARTRHWVQAERPPAPPVAAAPAPAAAPPAQGIEQEVMAMLQDGLLTEAQARELLSV